LAVGGERGLPRVHIRTRGGKKKIEWALGKGNKPVRREPRTEKIGETRVVERGVGEGVGLPQSGVRLPKGKKCKNSQIGAHQKGHGV